MSRKLQSKTLILKDTVKSLLKTASKWSKKILKLLVFRQNVSGIKLLEQLWAQAIKGIKFQSTCPFKWSTKRTYMAT